MMPKGNLTEAEKRILLQFDDTTFTLEIRYSKARDMLVEAGYLLKHPGILGSKMSYYRTKEGIALWHQLQTK